MKEYEIHLDDWTRILFGDVPPAFYAELVFRAAFVFVLLLLSMRMLGKRMAAQLSRNDMTALVSLAAAIGVPVLAPDRGLLPAAIIALIVVGITRLSSYINFQRKKAETITVGDVSLIVENGIINQRELRRSKLSRERLMAQLRSERVFHLGEVKRLYMEANGEFSVILEKTARSGLLVLPAGDEEYVQRVVEYTKEKICIACGHKVNEHESERKTSCRNCHSHIFTKAVKRR